MVCEHLSMLENALLVFGAKETDRGQVWSKNCREWVYFDVVLDIDELKSRFKFPDCVEVHENLDERSGTERGFYCDKCKDAVMGLVNGDKRYPS